MRNLLTILFGRKKKQDTEDTKENNSKQTAENNQTTEQVKETASVPVSIPASNPEPEKPVFDAHKYSADNLLKQLNIGTHNETKPEPETIKEPAIVEPQKPAEEAKPE
ncbi:MAG TPA: hypothetical protein O0X39_03040, partial [Methanocorpusculum sp.]|nr:hypothetical protein [Methanocorpusculum sp.]